jgi:hypothetical protein
MYSHHGCLCTEPSRACIFVACHPHPPPTTGARDHSPRTRARTPAARMPQGRLTGKMVRAGQAWYRTLPRQAARSPLPGAPPRCWRAWPTRSPSRSSRTSSPVRSPASLCRAKTLASMSRSRQEARTGVKGRRARCSGHGVPPTRSAPEAPAVRPAREAWPNGHREPPGRARSHPQGQARSRNYPGGQARARSHPGGPGRARSHPRGRARSRSHRGRPGRARSHPRGQARSRSYAGRRVRGRRHLLVLELGRDLLIPACGPRHQRPRCPGAGQWPDRRRTGQIRDGARASQPCRHLRPHQVRHPALVRRQPCHLGLIRGRTRRAEARQVRFGPGLRPPSLGPTRRLPARLKSARPGTTRRGAAKPGAARPGAGGGSHGER